jgi:hypothetical protein
VTRLIHHLRSNAIAYLALIVALGGTSYAAINLPANSVGPRQLKSGAVTTNKLANGSVTAKKLDGKSIGGSVLHWANVREDGHVLGGSRGASASLAAGHRYRITWGKAFANRCAVFASSPGVEGHAPIADSIGTQIIQSPNGKSTSLWVFPYSGGGGIAAPLSVAVVC